METVELIKMASLANAVLAVYDVAEDDRKMRETLLADVGASALAFDQLRKDYPQRLEFPHYRVRGVGDKTLANQLSELKFKTA